MPRWFALLLGYRCNNRCLFCGQAEVREADAQPVAEPALRAALEAARASGSPGVWLVGGEPTLREDLPQLIGLAREVGFSRVGLQTNGRRLAYGGYRQDLLAAGLTDLEVSLQGSSADCHDHLTRVPGAFEQTLRGLRGLSGSGLRLGLATLLDRSNFRHLGELLRLALRLEAQHLRWSFPQDRGEVRQDPRRVGPRLTLLAPRLRAVADQLAAAGGGAPRPSLAGVPDCHHPEGFRRGPADLSEGLRTFGEACAACPSRESCPGLAAGYARHHGTAELTPPATAREILPDDEAPGLYLA
ncbi:MAG: radical SAM protein [Deltaproteobacteria bacterium]|nr:radical SAM protein [Deltaproteobacteria bacterium]